MFSSEDYLHGYDKTDLFGFL